MARQALGMIETRGWVALVEAADAMAKAAAVDLTRWSNVDAGMVTIQAVEVTADYAHAKVFFSVLVGDPKECEEALNQAAGFLRNGLFKRLHIHTVPTLHFHFDRTTERAADMNALIAKAVSSRAHDD